MLGLETLEDRRLLVTAADLANAMPLVGTAPYPAYQTPSYPPYEVHGCLQGQVDLYSVEVAEGGNISAEIQTSASAAVNLVAVSGGSSSEAYDSNATPSTKADNGNSMDPINETATGPFAVSAGVSSAASVGRASASSTIIDVGSVNSDGSGELSAEISTTATSAQVETQVETGQNYLSKYFCPVFYPRLLLSARLQS